MRWEYLCVYSKPNMFYFLPPSCCLGFCITVQWHDGQQSLKLKFSTFCVFCWLQNLEIAAGASLVAQMVKNLPVMQENPGSIPGWGRSPGEGSGSPVLYSCLENPMDWGAWQATIHGSQTVGHDRATNTQLCLSFPHVLVLITLISVVTIILSSTFS